MKSLQSFDYTNKLFFCYCIPCLWSCQFMAVECDWHYTLDNHCYHPEIAIIRMDIKMFIEIRVL